MVRQAPYLFGVVTWGAAASRWLAHAIDAHPAVFCVHALNAEIAALDGRERLDGHDYLYLLALQGNGYVAAGDVHGISRDGALQAQRSIGDQVRFAVLIRDPEARLLSQFALFRAEADTAHWEIGYIDSMIRERRIELPDASYESRLVVHGANMQNMITEEAAIGPVYRMEDVTTSADKVGELLAYLTHGSAEPTPEWRATALRTAPTNSHRNGDTPVGLAEWEQEVVRRVVSAEAWTRYADLGCSLPKWL